MLNDPMTASEAKCNGDYPADNGERKVIPCPRCESCYVPSVFAYSAELDKAFGVERGQPLPRGERLKYCPDCRTKIRLKARVQPFGIGVITQGDPRGYVVRLTMPSGSTNTWAQDGIGVPTRNR